MGTTLDKMENDENILRENELLFFVNNNKHTVQVEELTPDLTLNSYLRNVLHLKGTKNMCLEGGCGACVVIAEIPNPNTNKNEIFAVNSCLVSALSCHGWKIHTVEELGGSLKGFHLIQKILVEYAGTQCGYCTSGMLMNMWALYSTGKLTMADVENSFGGNICRCTGYRPILAAFKSLAKDYDPALIGTFPTDIEDIEKCNKSTCQNECGDKCVFNTIPTNPIQYEIGDAKWIKAFNLKNVLDTLRDNKNKSYYLVNGNTAKGVFPDYKKPVELYIDISGVVELKKYEIRDKKLIIGAGTTLNKLKDIFKKTSKEHSEFSFLKKLAHHIDLIANVPVRNIGSIAGNLMLRHDHGFPSDIFLTLETVGASLNIVDSDGNEQTIPVRDIIKFDMRYKLIHYVSIPPLKPGEKYKSYKIMPRAQNVHAIVNAGFLFKFSDADLVESATIVYGNINKTFVHAEAVEKYLVGKDLFNNDVLQEAYKLLSTNLQPEYIPPDPSPEMRKGLAIALFYKTVLKIAPSTKVNNIYKSGGAKLQRPISSGVQEYDTNKSLYPLTQPVRKLESYAQVSGEAEYIMDMPDIPHQLFGAFVTAKAPAGSVIKKIDPTKALALKDVVAFYSAKDIPGVNSFIPKEILGQNEEIFCSDKILNYDQALGVIVAKTHEIALSAAELVDVTYDLYNKKPLLTIRDVLKSKESGRVIEKININPKTKGNDTTCVIQGSMDLKQQYHFQMETQCVNVIPNENGLDVYPSTQWMDLTQIAIANMLKITNNRVHLNVRRCGGGFGSKISRNNQISCAAALAAWKLRKPVKMSLPLSTNMNVVGKRFPCSTDYEVGVNDAGIFQYLNCTFYSDVGCHSNEDPTTIIKDSFINTYKTDTFNLEFNIVFTDMYANTWARAPGGCEGTAAIEVIMDHIAYATGLDPIDLRLVNLPDGSEFKRYLKEIKEWADIDNRKKEVEKFNKENRWKKKGISVIPMVYNFPSLGPYTCSVIVYHFDGTVAISHGGIEIGQGINTKVAQVCAWKLGIPLEKIVVTPSDTLLSPNNFVTGSSLTTESIIKALLNACDTLLERLKPIKEANQNAPWEEIVNKAYGSFINLSVTGLIAPNDPKYSEYLVYGVCCSEVEVDILTGQHILSRVDLIEDTGLSLSPIIDIGQVEGAFIMGLGYYTLEEMKFDVNGKVLTNNTWTYHPPGAKDIPVDFRIKIPKNNVNPAGVLNSKAIAEPPLCLTISIPLAIRNALASARLDVDKNNNPWYPIDGTTSVENIFENSLNNFCQYQL